MTLGVENCKGFAKQFQVTLAAKRSRQGLKASLTPCTMYPQQPNAVSARPQKKAAAPTGIRRLRLLRDNLLLGVSWEGAEVGKGKGRWQMG